ncbi:hypothetical protein R3P38DRAFT_3477939 [Favolaschia claudopus]|uniref:Uncharacterized protein n=1 Tax=Favolaschia claudopus TaxID=2862362 RepID=A0AAV9ZB81_9AGAR
MLSDCDSDEPTTGRGMDVINDCLLVDTNREPNDEMTRNRTRVGTGARSREENLERQILLLFMKIKAWPKTYRQTLRQAPVYMYRSNGKSLSVTAKQFPRELEATGTRALSTSLETHTATRWYGTRDRTYPLWALPHAAVPLSVTPEHTSHGDRRTSSTALRDRNTTPRSVEDISMKGPCIYLSEGSGLTTHGREAIRHMDVPPWNQQRDDLIFEKYNESAMIDMRGSIEPRTRIPHKRKPAKNACTWPGHL